MDHPRPPDQFAELPFYSAHFMDPVIWEPYVRNVVSAQGYECQQILPGWPGTYPTFLAEVVSESTLPKVRWMVVKFFGRLFEGKDSFIVERGMGYFIAQYPLNIPSPAILADGQLTNDWFYLVFECIPGVSIGTARMDLSDEAWQGVARQMGIFMKKLHTITAAKQPIFPSADSPITCLKFEPFLENQRANSYDNHQRWGDLPPGLVEQLPSFIPPVDQLVDLSAAPHLIHADLTADHLIGRLDSAQAIEGVPQAGESNIPLNNAWKSLAIIDWGDSRMGNILYELAALHIDMFRADKNLLRTCLEAYNLPAFYQQDFARKALSMLLLHQFAMPDWVYQPHQDVRSLGELGDRLFGI